MSEKLSQITEEATTVNATDRFYLVQGGVSKYIDGTSMASEYGGGGGGAVDSVNGETGVVVLKEEDIIGTAIEDATWTGTENLDLETFAGGDFTLTGNTTITVSNTPSADESFVKTIGVTSDTTETLTLPVSWNVYGEYVADGTRNKLSIEFSNYTTAGAIVDCFISQPS